MRRLLIAVLVLVASVSAQTINVPLPCESTSQDISPTGKHVAVHCKDHSLRVLDLPGGREIAKTDTHDRVSTTSFSPDGHFLGIGTSIGDIQILALSAAATPKRWHTIDRPVDVLKFILGTELLIIGPLDRPGQVWNFSATPTKKATLETDFAGLTSAAASPDGKLLVTTGGDTVVRFFDIATWKQVHQYRDLTLEPFAATFTTDGKFAIVGGADGQLTLLDPATGKVAKRLPVQPDPIQELQIIDANQLAVLYFDADGYKPPHLQIWNIQTGDSKPVAMSGNVTGGGVVSGRMWFAMANAKSLELVVGE
jgi:WD40 repeat protein